MKLKVERRLMIAVRFYMRGLKQEMPAEEIIQEKAYRACTRDLCDFGFAVKVWKGDECFLKPTEAYLELLAEHGSKAPRFIWTKERVRPQLLWPSGFMFDIFRR